MHEWAIAEGIVATVLKSSGGKKVKKVKLQVGELQQIDLEILEFAVKEISKIEQGKEIAEIDVEIERTEFECHECHKRWRLHLSRSNTEIAELVHFLPESSKIHLRCPHCGSSDFEISGGRGVCIESFVIQE
ncbi:MAG: hydrogenase nickel incorporation protein HypA [Candidatus Hadarchaeales archaeon]